MNDAVTNHTELLKELAYFRKQLDRLTAEAIRNDFIASAISFELKQKKQAFSILSALQNEFPVNTPIHIIFSKTVRAIHEELDMDRSVILVPAHATDTFKPGYYYGYSEEEATILEMREIEIPSEVLISNPFFLLNSNTCSHDICHQIRRKFSINYFVGVPILLDEKPVAFIFCGRQFDKLPFHPPIVRADADTVTAIASLISTVLKNKMILELKLQMKEQLNEKNEILNIFGQQVSKDVAKALMRKNEDRGERKKIAVMFLDIRNFTPFVQNKTPEDTLIYLNSLFSFMAEIIEQHNGIINQFLGDGFMTTFGAPVDVSNPFQNALSTALCIHETLQEKIRNNEIPFTRIGIGIHGGEAVVGNVGSSSRKQYTITGNVVIIAARMEQLTKQYDAQILISKDIYEQANCKDYPVQPIGDVVLKGMSNPIAIYQVI